MEDFSIESLEEFIGDREGVHLDSWGNENIEVPFPIRAKEFLKSAEYDLSSEYDRHLVNALSNIKRAIDCQLDSLLFGFGLFEKSKKKKWHFPDKIVCLNKIGITSPRILERINQQRNLLEHEYTSPDKKRVEDALDVATLFLAYTDKFLYNALIECEPFNDIEPDSFEVKLVYKENKIIFLDRYSRTINGLIKKEATANSEEYIDYLRWFVSLYKLM